METPLIECKKTRKKRPYRRKKRPPKVEAYGPITTIRLTLEAEDARKELETYLGKINMSQFVSSVLVAWREYKKKEK